MKGDITILCDTKSPRVDVDYSLTMEIAPQVAYGFIVDTVIQTTAEQGAAEFLALVLRLIKSQQPDLLPISL